jgi:molybdopterin-guanine dinucleotide biosynthesis protein
MMKATVSSTRFLVVGGHTRSIGKTALVEDLIRAFPEAHWTAVKITQFGHGICSQNGESCGCAVDEHTVAMDSEIDPARGTDSSRFLAAGATRSFWLRTKQGRLAEGMPLLRSAFSASANDHQPASVQNAIIESNSVLQFLQPALYLVVLDASKLDFKDSTRLSLDRADAFILRNIGEGEANPTKTPPWAGVAPSLLGNRPIFSQGLGDPLPGALTSLVRERFFH